MLSCARRRPGCSARACGSRTAACRCLGDARGRCASAVCTMLLERAERRAGRDRIGGVGRDQQRRPVAAPQRALEVRRDLDRRTARRPTRSSWSNSASSRT